MSEKPKPREISDEKSAQKMLANLGKGSQKTTREPWQRNAEMDKYKVKGKEKSTENKTDDNKNTTTTGKNGKNVMIYPKNTRAPAERIRFDSRD